MTTPATQSESGATQEPAYGLWGYRAAQLMLFLLAIPLAPFVLALSLRGVQLQQVEPLILSLGRLPPFFWGVNIIGLVASSLGLMQTKRHMRLTVVGFLLNLFFVFGPVVVMVWFHN